MSQKLIQQDNSHNDFKKRTRFLIAFQSIIIALLIITTIKFYSLAQEREILGVSSDGVSKLIRIGKDYEKNDSMKRLHSRMFFELMFAGNKANYRQRIKSGLNLINRQDGKYIYNDMKKEGVFDIYERYPNMRTEIMIDSIVINKKVLPEEVSVYAVQYALYPDDNILTSDEIEPLLIAAKFNLLDLGLDYVDDKNPLGFMIQNFNFFAYKLKK